MSYTRKPIRFVVEKMCDPDVVRPMLNALVIPDDQRKLLPSRFSPSSLGTYDKCPRKFWFTKIAKLSDPSSFAALRGSIAHRCLELIFDLPPAQRTPDRAVAFMAQAWQEIHDPDVRTMDPPSMQRALRDAESACSVVRPGSPEETMLMAEAERCVRNWFNMERVQNFTPTGLELPNGDVIDGRELELLCELGNLTIAGIVDRLDRYESADGQIRWSITDYKSGDNIPWEKKAEWSESFKEKLRNDYFFQLRIYALVAYYMFGIRVSLLRLVYIGVGDREKGIREEYMTGDLFRNTEAKIKSIVRQIRNDAAGKVHPSQRWAGKTGALCGHCYFAPVCPDVAADYAQHLEMRSSMEQDAAALAEPVTAAA